ncbi:MAG: hypothetical protein ACE5IR_19045 [bacterium]
MEEYTMIRIIAVTIFALAGIVRNSVVAQPLWVDVRGRKTISVEVLKIAHLFSGIERTFGTGALFVSGRFPVSDRIVLVGDLSVAHAGFSDGYAESQTIVGNPYLGLEFGNLSSTLYLEFGIRPRVASDNKGEASSIGKDADVDRAEAFNTINGGHWTFLARLNLKRKISSNFGIRLRAGPTLFVFKERTAGIPSGDPEVLVDYSAQLCYEGKLIGFIFGFTGRMWLTASVREASSGLGERTLHQIGLTTSIKWGMARPGIHLRYLHDNLNLFNLYGEQIVYGLNLAFNFK